MISGLSRYSGHQTFIHYFHNMQQEGCLPDEVTFSCILSACSSMGLVDQGWIHFNSITQKHGLSTTMEHCNHMVDILGRAGFLSDAKDLLVTFPLESNTVGWTLLIQHCRMHGNVAFEGIA